MCLSKSSTAVGKFSSIDNAMAAINISWDNCVALGVDNTSVDNKHNSLIVEARKNNPHIILMGWPCAGKKSTKAFCNSLQNSFDVEELLV